MSDTVRVSGRFRRVFDLSKQGGDPPTSPPRPGWVYLPPALVADKTRRRRWRGRLVRIVARQTGVAIHRRLAFGARLRKGGDGTPGEVGLDWDSWNALQDGGDADVLDLEIRPSRSLLAWAGVGHPDPTVHTAATLGLVGLALGILSLVLALLPLVP